ncbi:hypothetical protein B0I37DRAFT_295282, partial [Chaetomium sp. MPI-CAGE-AT-0009]
SRRIPRPLNAFLLYRKCYLEHARAFCEGRTFNHQWYSCVLAASWRMETCEVRDKFREWSNVEHQKHKEAHPGYKFQPNK